MAKILPFEKPKTKPNQHDHSGHIKAQLYTIMYTIMRDLQRDSVYPWHVVAHGFPYCERQARNIMAQLAEDGELVRYGQRKGYGLPPMARQQIA